MFVLNAFCSLYFSSSLQCVAVEPQVAYCCDSGA